VKEQVSIPKTKITRAANLVGSGAKIGVYYAKYAIKKALTSDSDKSDFHEATAKETYRTFSKLKGAPLKLAQMLSMDRNLIPAQYADEFAKAQYSAPPLSYPLVVKTFQQEMGKGPAEVFDTFSKSAVAGASIGQVHKASLGDEEFAVKIQYPGVAQSLNSDLAIVKPLAMRLFNIDAKSIEPYVEEIKARLLEETDYERELKTSEDLIERSKDLPNTKFPRYHKNLSSKRILTMSWIDGVQLDQYAIQEESQEKRDKIAQAVWDFYHHQIHTLRVFHADPHPGNFLIQGDDLVVLDFGCVKELPETFYQDYFKIIQPDILKLENRDYFVKMLYQFDLLLKSDSPEDVKMMTNLFAESIELLSRPFVKGEFDFGDQGYFDELIAFGEKTRKDSHIQSLNQARGSAHALYLNRTYFGVYNICGLLKAKVKTEMPINPLSISEV
jgi:predicted unusual protein kinase regulating ubiquinone biosynthesis (AarF/ABC1/UbiB family)